MIKHAVIVMTLIALLAAASCSGAGQPGGLQESLNAPPDASTAVPAVNPTAKGPQLPRSSSAMDGISYLIQVTQMKANDANDDALAGIIAGIIDLITGEEEEIGRSIDAHENAALGTVGFQVWRVVECSLGAALKQVSPGDGLPAVLAVGLESEDGAPAYATYGVKEMPANWSLSSLKLGGRGEQFYVGVSDYQQQRWRWLGPFSMGSGTGAEMQLGPVEITLPAVQNENAEGFSYFTVVPAPGSELLITGAELSISDPSWTFDPGILDGDVLADF